MKLYLSIDMEGMPGTYNWDQEKTDRATVKSLMSAHVELVLKEILQHPKASAIEEIVIADSHAGGDNLGFEITALDKSICLISGGPRPRYMLPDFDAEYDRVFLLGYHSGTGALMGNMDHTYSNSRVHKIFINDKAMNEALINAAYAGYHKVPVALVTGDEALRKELFREDAMPWLDYVSTKRAVAKFAAKNYSSLRVDLQIKNAVERALNKDRQAIPLYSFSAPVKLNIEFHSTAMTDVACLMPYVKRLDGRNIEFVEDNYGIVFEALMALVTLASTASM
ncbi:MAG: M55 family metallopeptidase [Candidatus Cloacimonadaceae bacterium]|nr:M55 family metallopeptidase [Candidatus Cloacimonadaceae bacterium]MDP3114904.1 M55 family metallopeptidase [Candidatus Cloacimonadaceae bacterium]